MSYKIRLLDKFKRDAKPLIKRYPSLVLEIQQMQQQLLAAPTSATPLGQNCYKIRLAIRSKGKGRSGGARVIFYFAVVDEEIVLLTIYDKAEKADLRPGELQELLKLLET